VNVQFNGQPLDGAFSQTRALQYGDGVFRTALIQDGRMVDRDAQLARLAADAEALCLQFDRDLLEREIDALIPTHARAALRISLSRVGSGRGYAPARDESDRLLQIGALPAYDGAYWTRGVDVGWSKVLLAVQPRLAGIKHLNRLEQVLASREMPADRQEMLMCDAEGRVTCGTRTNLFLLIDGILVTPDLSMAGVAGMMRGKLVELARRNGMACEIGLISPDEVRHASEGFVCNSLIGIWPIRRLGALEWPAPGKLTQTLMQHLNHPWSGA
jgi:4-amino-4-deoxychorismate lyase